MLEAEREQLAEACRRLSDLVIGTAGNVSVRAGDHVVVTPSGCVFDDVDAGDMTVVSMDGEKVDGPYGPTSELALHLAVYERMGAGAVVHTHAPYATALSCVLDEVPAVHYGMLQLGGSLRVAPYATFGTEELAAHVQRALEGRTACLMQNHGAVNYAHDLEYAVDSALLVEWACQLYWNARAIGTPRALTDAELQDVATQVAQLGYGKTK